MYDGYRIEWRNNEFNEPYHAKKRYHNAVRCKLAEKTANQRNPIGRTQQQIRIHPLKMQQAL